MISTFIANNYHLVQAILITTALLCILVAAMLVRAGTRGRRIAAVIAGLGVVVILALTLVPDIEPLDTVSCSFIEPRYFLGDEQNMALFFLPTLFAVVALRRPLVVLVTSIALSATIELVQAVTPILGRRCDINDLLANITGAAAGVVVAVLVVAVMTRFLRRQTARIRSGRR